MTLLDMIMTPTVFFTLGARFVAVGRAYGVPLPPTAAEVP